MDDSFISLLTCCVDVKWVFRLGGLKNWAFRFQEVTDNDQVNQCRKSMLKHSLIVNCFLQRCTLVIFLKARKGKSQNRISLKQQRFLKNDKSESFLDFYLVYKYV